MSSLPKEIQGEILLRLPVKSILRFKFLCKSWYELVCTPKFVDDHLSLAQKNPRVMIKNANILPDGDMFYSVGYTSILTRSVSLSSTTCKCDGAVLMDNPVIKENGVENRLMNILGSCNGLLCLQAASRTGMVILWNPSTCEYKEISLPLDYYREFTCYGFGYDSKIKDYKLVFLAPKKVYQYTLKSNSWSIFNTITYGQVRGQSIGLLLNGVLHWPAAATITGISNCIVSFEISSEKFMNWPFPEEIIQDKQTYKHSAKFMLEVLGDSLCLVCGYLNVRVDVWVMQNYGVRESWIKKFTTTQVSITSNPHQLKLYWYVNNGELLLQVREDFVLYDQKNNKIRFLHFDGIDNRFSYLESVSYVESLVSLNSGTYMAKNRSRKRKFSL